MNTAQQTDLGLAPHIEYRFYSSAEPDAVALVTQAIEEFGRYHMGVPDTILINPLLRVSLPEVMWNGAFPYGPIAINIISTLDTPEYQDKTVYSDTVLCLRHNSVVETTDYTTAPIEAIETIGGQHADEAGDHAPTLVTPAV